MAKTPKKSMKKKLEAQKETEKPTTNQKKHTKILTSAATETLKFADADAVADEVAIAAAAAEEDDIPEADIVPLEEISKETDLVTDVPYNTSVSRQISINNITQSNTGQPPVITNIFLNNKTPSDGTPQKVLYNVAKICITIIKQFLTADTTRQNGSKFIINQPDGKLVYTTKVGSSSRQKTISTDIESLCEKMNTYDREWQHTTSKDKVKQEVKTHFEGMLEYILNKILKSGALNDNDKFDILSIIALNFYVKGISDISQFSAALENLINDTYFNVIEDYQPIPTNTLVSQPLITAKNQILAQLYLYLKKPEVVFVSSDILACSLATFVAKLYPAPLQLLCTRKTKSVGTVDIICQKRDVSFFSILIGNTPLYIIDLLVNNGVVDINKQSIIDNFNTTDINTEYNDALDKNTRLILLLRYINIAKCNFLGIDENITFADAETINAKCEENISRFLNKTQTNLVSYTRHIRTQSVDFESFANGYILSEIFDLDERQYFKQRLYIISSFIDLLYNVLIRCSDFITELSGINYQGDIECSRFGYVLANTVFKIQYPLKPIDKQDLDNAVFYGGLCDWATGHDFAGIKHIRDLGVRFCNILPDDVKRLPNDVFANIYNEQQCINAVIEYNGYITMTTKNNNCVYRFNNERNFLTEDSKELVNATCNIEKFNFFQPLLSLAPIYYIIDFTSGLQPYLDSKIILNNSLINATNDDIYRITYPDIVVETFKQKVDEGQYKIIREIFTPATFYDGAAVFGLIPIYLINSAYTINLFISTKMLQIVTTVNDTIIRDANSFLERKINSTKSPLTTALTKLFLNEDIKTKIKISNPFLRFFDNIWKKYDMLNIKGNYFNKKMYIQFLNKVYDQVISNGSPFNINTVFGNIPEGASLTLINDRIIEIHRLVEAEKQKKTIKESTYPTILITELDEIFNFIMGYLILLLLDDTITPEIKRTVLLTFISWIPKKNGEKIPTTPVEIGILEGTPMCVAEISRRTGIQPTVAARTSYLDLRSSAQTSLPKLNIAQYEIFELLKHRITDEELLLKGISQPDIDNYRFAYNTYNKAIHAQGIKSHKKNKLRRRRTYKRGKEGHFLPTPTKTHKRRHRTTHKSIDQLEKIRVKLRKELKPTRKRV